MTTISEASFAIVAHGFADGPAQALRDYVIQNGARATTTIFHPLVPEGDTRHEITQYERDEIVDVRRVRLPFRPPLTYPLDLLIPPWPKRVDCWFGFNSLVCARGIGARSAGRAEKVVYWCVDFVPDRFGRGAVTRAYDILDRFCCLRSDARFELSEAARDGRDRRHGLGPNEGAPARIVPMGAWLDRVPTTAPDALERRTLIFLGHLVPRQGVRLVIETVALLRRRGVKACAEIIGRGPLEGELRTLAKSEGVEGSVAFHGFVADHKVVERLLASASIAVAPYEPDAASFTRFADPGKLKAYLAAGLPILLTRVPPNANELAEQAGAEIIPFDAAGIADAVERLLTAPPEWKRRREAALNAAEEYDWPRLLGPALASLGYHSERR